MQRIVIIVKMATVRCVYIEHIKCREQTFKADRHGNFYNFSASNVVDVGG